MRRFGFGGLVILLMLLSCSDRSSPDPGELKDEVLSIHDEAMAKMSDLRKVEKELRALSASLADSVRSGEMLRQADEIKTANDRMRLWMRAYEPNFEGTEKEYVKYLEDQKIAIEQVRQAMDSALKEGKAVLEQ